MFHSLLSICRMSLSWKHLNFNRFFFATFSLSYWKWKIHQTHSEADKCNWIKFTSKKNFSYLTFPPFFWIFYVQKKKLGKEVSIICISLPSPSSSYTLFKCQPSGFFYFSAPFSSYNIILLCFPLAYYKLPSKPFISLSLFIIRFLPASTYFFIHSLTWKYAFQLTSCPLFRSLLLSRDQPTYMIVPKKILKAV